MDGDQLRFDIAFAAIVAAEAERTVYCHPDEAARIRAALDRLHGGHLITVVPSRVITDRSRIVMVDENALAAAAAEDAQHARRDLKRRAAEQDRASRFRTWANWYGTAGHELRPPGIFGPY